jgi:hypothetical protein
VVQEAVEDGGGQDVVAQDAAPFEERLVGGDANRAACVVS